MNADLKILREEIARVLRKNQNILIKSKNFLHEGVKYRLKDGSFEAGDLQDFIQRDRLALVDNKPQIINEHVALLNSLSKEGFKPCMIESVGSSDEAADDKTTQYLKDNIFSKFGDINLMIIDSQNKDCSINLKVAEELNIPVIVWLKAGTAEIKITTFSDKQSLNSAINEEIYSQYYPEPKVKMRAYR